MDIDGANILQVGEESASPSQVKEPSCRPWWVDRVEAAGMAVDRGHVSKQAAIDDLTRHGLSPEEAAHALDHWPEIRGQYTPATGYVVEGHLRISWRRDPDWELRWVDPELTAARKKFDAVARSFTAALDKFNDQS